jgi:hypothetical protein
MAVLLTNALANSPGIEKRSFDALQQNLPKQEGKFNQHSAQGFSE